MKDNSSTEGLSHQSLELCIGIKTIGGKQAAWDHRYRSQIITRLTNILDVKMWHPYGIPSQCILSNGSCFVWATFSYNYPISNLKVSSVLLHYLAPSNIMILAELLWQNNERIRMGLYWPFNLATFLSLISHPSTWIISRGESANSVVLWFYSWGSIFVLLGPSYKGWWLVTLHLHSEFK